MALEVTKTDVWAGEIQDQPGSLAGVLGPISASGANYEGVIARRNADKPGSGTIFLAPVKGKKQQDAARGAGLRPATDVATLKIEGPDKAGLAHKMTTALADAGINLRGFSAMVTGKKFVCFIGLDNAQDAARAAKILKGIK
jgi:hypothetical protein